ncbi:hypothetical protein [Mesorhizobium sp.]|uniref:hypothetical protein n=1 Tax=Mesorhizobium sp. TaxID=1871066 RepID=UPI0012090251|nr:hypothetical protein [Mesorhizobium sp.]TIL31702.1 MAG: hypothetical protein E5Y82_29925 [Mesorhizobium sp.]
MAADSCRSNRLPQLGKAEVESSILTEPAIGCPLPSKTTPNLRKLRLASYPIRTIPHRFAPG